jgi:FKBP-type peptidyl-prolyl cis-trans isomerase 2
MHAPRLVIVALALGVIAAACSGDGSTSTEPLVSTGADAQGFIAQDGDLVEVHYVLTLDDGTVQDSSRDRGSTFTFTVGAGDVIAGFDTAVRGAKVGDLKTVRMEADQGYGEWSEANIVAVPFNPDQGDVAVGDEVFLTNGQPAVVIEVTAETVTLDANHPLAGEALTFEIEVISITRA